MLKRGKNANKQAQIWIETVIYTLIAFVLIATVLAFVKPKIDEIQDNAIIEQSISMVNSIDSTIMEIIQGGSGNKRKVEVGIKKGELKIDGSGDSLVFEMESNFLYSEPGKDISQGNLIIRTDEQGDLNFVSIKRVYADYNITFNGNDELKALTKSAVPYNIFITNKGKENEKWVINFELS